MVGKPLARRIGRGPRWPARVVDSQLVAQVDLEPPQTAHGIPSGRDLRVYDLEVAVDGRLKPTRVIGAVPSDGVLPGPEGRLAQQIAHAPPVGVVDG